MLYMEGKVTRDLFLPEATLFPVSSFNLLFKILHSNLDLLSLLFFSF